MNTHTPHSRSKAAKKNILVVEDEGEMCLLLNVILDDDSVEMQHINTLLGAQEILDSKKPDVVLLDNRLPDGYGFDFIRYIKNTCPKTKVIMMSGVDIAAGDSAVEAGADAFLVKPFNRSTLKAALHQVLQTDNPMKIDAGKAPDPPSQPTPQPPPPPANPVATDN